MNKLTFNTHPEIAIEVHEIGEEKQPLILVDNFLNDAEQLVAYADKNLQLTSTSDLYPGVRATCPPSYMDFLIKHLGKLISSTFSISPQDMLDTESYFSIVATPPQLLHPLQRIPHMDGTNPNDIAFLHYLCDERFGGTSFYRHITTGHEFVNQKRINNYIEKLENELIETGLPTPPKYMDGDNHLFERIESIAAKFNRLIIYRGTSLHSGDIGADYTFDINARTGRLSVTSFTYSKG